MTDSEKQIDQWVQVDVAVPKNQAETAAYLLSEEFGTGVQELSSAVCQDDSLQNNEVCLRIFLKNTSEPACLKDTITRILLPWDEHFSAASIVISTTPDEDWNSNWKAHFKPIKVASRFIIAPSWEPIPDTEGRIVIRIDPGQAFGTGTHATTQMALEAMEKIWTVRQDNGLSLNRILDLGAGTGILGIAAARLMCDASVVCADIDPLAVEACQQNAALNDVRLEVIEGSIDQANGDFDIILANLDKNTFLLLADKITEKIHAGATLILSGILVVQMEQVTNELSKRGLCLTEVIEDREQEWACLTIHSNDH